MQIFRRKSIDNNTFLAIPRNPSKIPRKFLARFNLNAYLCHRYNIHVEHST